MSSSVDRFGIFQLDPAARELRRGDEALQLPRKVFDCIVYLVENRDRAIGRDELVRAIWGHSELTDNALGQTIRLARQALGDTGEEQHAIKTVRGYGYHWIAAVEAEPAPAPPGTESAAPDAGGTVVLGVRRNLLVIALAGTAAIVLAAVLYFRSSAPTAPLDTVSPPRAEGEIALLLPVAADSDAGDAWIRLGLMDLIAERLRAAGQTMVPSDTVIALMQELPGEPDAAAIAQLEEMTGARLILAAQARATGARWTVHLHSLAGAQPPLSAASEAYDILEAAQIAADRMGLALGLAPAPEPESLPGFQELKRRIEAARLSQQIDLAGELIEQASDELRRHPEIRFQQGRILFYGEQPKGARAMFEALLDDIGPEQEPELYARTLNGLAVIHVSEGERGAARPLMLQAARILEQLDLPEPLGPVYMNLGNLAQEQGDLDAARAYMAQARRVYEAVGNVFGLAQLDSNVGVLETRRSRYAKALTYFKRAAERFGAMQSIRGELRTRAYMIFANLKLLDLRAAAAVEPRVDALLDEAPDGRFVADARLAKARLLAARGGSPAQVDTLLEEVLALGAHERESHWISARVQIAERALGKDPEQGAELAGDILDSLEEDVPGLHDSARGRVWLILIRSYLARGDVVAATAEATAMDTWVRYNDNLSARIGAALAVAEVACANGREQEAVAEYEQAWALAEQSQVPIYLLRVAKSYVPWLLEAAREPELNGRALSLVESLVEYADSHYDVALLQLRVYHALGPVSVWRTAFERARALAGERDIPDEFRQAPR